MCNTYNTHGYIFCGETEWDGFVHTVLLWQITSVKDKNNQHKAILVEYKDTKCVTFELNFALSLSDKLSDVSYD